MSVAASLCQFLVFLSFSQLTVSAQHRNPSTRTNECALMCVCVCVCVFSTSHNGNCSDKSSAALSFTCLHKCVCVCAGGGHFSVCQISYRSVRANKLLHGLRTLQMGHCLEAASLRTCMCLNVHEHTSVWRMWHSVYILQQYIVKCREDCLFLFEYNRSVIYWGMWVD